MTQRLRSLLLSLPLLAATAGAASAACDDGPRAGVDWTNCLLLNKHMAGSDFRGAMLASVGW